MSKVFKIPINLSTLKKNPRAGQTQSLLLGRKEFQIQMGADYIPDMKKIKDLGIAIQKMQSGDGVYRTWVADGILFKKIDVDKEPDPEEIKKNLSAMGISSETSMTQHHEVIRHHPLPNWLFEYEKTEVQCEHCEKCFSYTQLGSDCYYDDQGEIYDDSICPKCGAWYCCDVEFQRVEDVLHLVPGLEDG